MLKDFILPGARIAGVLKRHYYCPFRIFLHIFFQYIQEKPASTIATYYSAVLFRAAQKPQKLGRYKCWKSGGARGASN